jgi:hypothetical protein
VLLGEDLLGALDAQLVLRLIELHALAQLEKLGEQVVVLRILLLGPGPILYDDPLDGPIQLLDGPEQARRVLQLGFHRHAAQQIDLAENEARFPALEVELEPGKPTAARATQKDDREDREESYGEENYDDYHIIAVIIAKKGLQFHTKLKGFSR